MPKLIRRFVVAFAMLACAVGAAAQSPSNEALREANLELMIANLQKTILALNDRIDALEARIASMEAAGVANPPLGVEGEAPDIKDFEPEDTGDEKLGEIIDGRVMNILSFERRAMEERLFTEARELRDEGQAYSVKADKLEREKTDLNLCHGHRTWPACGCINNDLHKKHAHERRIKQRELGRQITKLRADANSCEKRADSLERDARTPRQTIYGWDGSRNIVLNTERNFERLLAKFDMDNAFITWVGDPSASLPDGTQTWLVRNIVFVPRPEGFRDQTD